MTEFKLGAPCTRSNKNKLKKFYSTQYILPPDINLPEKNLHSQKQISFRCSSKMQKKKLNPESFIRFKSPTIQRSYATTKKTELQNTYKKSQANNKKRQVHRQQQNNEINQMKKRLQKQVECAKAKLQQMTNNLSQRKKQKQQILKKKMSKEEIGWSVLLSTQIQ